MVKEHRSDWDRQRVRDESYQGYTITQRSDGKFSVSGGGGVLDGLSFSSIEAAKSSIDAVATRAAIKQGDPIP